MQVPVAPWLSSLSGQLLWVLPRLFSAVSSESSIRRMLEGPGAVLSASEYRVMILELMVDSVFLTETDEPSGKRSPIVPKIS